MPHIFFSALICNSIYCFRALLSSFRKHANLSQFANSMNGYLWMFHAFKNVLWHLLILARDGDNDTVTVK